MRRMSRSDHPAFAAQEPPTRVTLGVTGMHCAGCVNRVEAALEEVPGVSRAEVNLALERAWVEGERPGLEADLVSALERAGFGAQTRVSRDAPEAQAAGQTDTGFRWTVFAMVLTLPLVLPMAGALLGMQWRLPPVAELVLAEVQLFQHRRGN